MGINTSSSSFGMGTDSPKKQSVSTHFQWFSRIDITPIPEEFRYEFLTRIEQQNFKRIELFSKFSIFLVAAFLIILDIANLPGLPPDVLTRAKYIRIGTLIAVISGYLLVRWLNTSSPTTSGTVFFLRSNIFRLYFTIVGYVLIFNIELSANNASIVGPFAVMVSIISGGLYAWRGYTVIASIINAAVYTGFVLTTYTIAPEITYNLGIGYAMLLIVGFTSVIQFQRYCREFAVTKQIEEERRKAEELNVQLSEANEEISKQIDILNEQAREIELANITLQEQYLVIEQDRKELAHSNALLDLAHAESESLLLNVLPSPIALRLKSGERAIADKFDSVTVLFADIVGFTKLSARTTPEELVQGLNTIFGRFDALAKEYGLEKIKTIGDAYMIAGGLPERSADHCERVAFFALEIQAVMREEALHTSTDEAMQLRIGIHTGEVVAGVIGTSKFIYDLWGDTVNTASRMESHGEAGEIHVSEEVYRTLTRSTSSLPAGSEEFIFEERGEIEVKGKGKMRTYFLKGLSS
jgi:class 3 adenylate cyclase